MNLSCSDESIILNDFITMVLYPKDSHLKPFITSQQNKDTYQKSKPEQWSSKMKSIVRAVDACKYYYDT